jgi:hypothetical protein
MNKFLIWIACVLFLSCPALCGQDKKLPIEPVLSHSHFISEQDIEDEVVLNLETNLVRALTSDGSHLDFVLGEGASTTVLSQPETDEASSVHLITAEQSVSLSDGTVVLSALDAEVVGETAKLETDPGNHRIGFWSDEKDFVRWSFKPSRWGKYAVDLVYSQAGEAGNLVEVSIQAKDSEAQTLEVELVSTGSWYRYTTVQAGTHYFDDQTYKQIHEFKVASKKKATGAVMNLKAVILRPISEGEQPVVAEFNGDLVFRSENATVIGTRLVYEPNPKKLTLGYWARVDDKARWDFSVEEAGEFDVQILQGCGKGQGGSQVAIDILPAGAFSPEPQVSAPLQFITFEVEDTGHFQNFKERSVGSMELEPGNYILQVRPMEKAKNAVMDLRELKLLKK